MEGRKELLVYVDGGARGNPGPSAVGVYVTDKKRRSILRYGKTIGVATNNVAEYQAVVTALDLLLARPALLKQYESVSVFVDSQLVYSQIVGLYKVRNLQLRELLFAVWQKQKRLCVPVVYSRIPRNENSVADRLVNVALDK